eukprot:TRINITY_DN26867_c0_g1_i1.p1 TRINITY_DN26867_c0_g1~~TRINITY_DN26867_c0_g1_i1.p1  ORF type:complete len:165 (+),score=19.39 TRINITY_DN26867_c0_g1_i1:652-1146(+)
MTMARNWSSAATVLGAAHAAETLDVLCEVDNEEGYLELYPILENAMDREKSEATTAAPEDHNPEHHHSDEQSRSDACSSDPDLEKLSICRMIVGVDELWGVYIEEDTDPDEDDNMVFVWPSFTTPSHRHEGVDSVAVGEHGCPFQLYMTRYGGPQFSEAAKASL